MSNYWRRYTQWLGSSFLNERERRELAALVDTEEIEDRFCRELEFGTGGLRGVMGVGTNRINRYTIRKVSYGLANYLKDMFGDSEKARGVVIAYDSRLNSKLFAEETALTLSTCGIKTFLFNEVQPTPVLSFAVKYLNCIAGIVITASHNPKQYNGYKVYDRFGCQILPNDANAIINYVNTVPMDKIITLMNMQEAVQSGMVKILERDVLEAFLASVSVQSLLDDDNAKADLHIVYTPLHGTGNLPVRMILNRVGFRNVSIVKEQELPDGNFPTVTSPNPEEQDALTLALNKARTENADIVLGTDPDCDRVGVGVKHRDEYVLLTGNQIGALLANFVLANKYNSLNSKSTLIKTIVTSDLGASIARNYGLQVEETLTGFKFIGNRITDYERTGTQEFTMGIEESYGYLVGTHVRDKDAVVSSMLICEMAAAYKAQGKTLVDVLWEIYDEYGYYLDILDSFNFEGIDGAKRLEEIMINLRAEGNRILPNIAVIYDYSQAINDLPKANVIKIVLNDGSWVAVRPSGTEPKLKIYYSIRHIDKTKAQLKLDNIRDILEQKLGLEAVCASAK